MTWVVQHTRSGFLKLPDDNSKSTLGNEYSVVLDPAAATAFSNEENAHYFVNVLNRRESTQDWKVASWNVAYSDWKRGAKP